MACKCEKCGKPCDCGEKYCEQCYLEECEKDEAKNRETVYEMNLRCGYKGHP